MNNIYSTQFEFSAHDTDRNDVVRPSAVLRVLQEGANRQMRDETPSYRDILNTGNAFILSRISVNIYKPLKIYDKVTVEAWPSDGKGIIFLRSQRMFRNGELVAESLGNWALVDIADRKFRTHEDFHPETYTYADPLKLDGMHFTMKGTELFDVSKHRVTYSEIDCNDHMNNTYYPDMLADSIPEINDGFVSSIRIRYVSEAKKGDEIAIKMSRPATANGITYSFQTETSKGINIEAMLTVNVIDKFITVKEIS